MLSAIEVDLVSTVVENWSVAVENRIHSYAPGPIKTSVDFVKMHFDANLLLRLKEHQLNVSSVITDHI